MIFVRMCSVSIGCMMVFSGCSVFMCSVSRKMRKVEIVLWIRMILFVVSVFVVVLISMLLKLKLVMVVDMVIVFLILFDKVIWFVFDVLCGEVLVWFIFFLLVGKV